MKKHSRIATNLVRLCTLLMLFSASYGQQAARTGAKDMFYDPATGETTKATEKRLSPPQKNTPPVMRKIKSVPIEQAKFVGIHYWVELDGVGQVTENRTFYTGERIKIHVRSNVDGYLSLWSLAPSGQAQLLFPRTNQGADDSFVKAGTDYAPTGFIKFSPPAENERLLIFFSKSKADFPSSSNQTTSAEVIAKAIPPTGSKALVFETESTVSSEIGSYVVNKMGGSVGREIMLRHNTRTDGR